MTKMIGKVYTMPPQPHSPANTEVFDVGAVRFGVEYRDVDPAGLVETYKDNPAYLAELLERSPEGGFTDEGVSIHVFGDDGWEYLRFDVFDDEPHYHFVHNTGGDEVLNNVIDFDATANGEMLDWVLGRLRTRLAPMLTRAGGGHLVDRLDPAAIDAALVRVAEVAAAAQASVRAGRVGRDG
jgi:hypothetical protein